jgi:eukaryotic-like serine/threonine-protein kinase
VKVLDFGIAKLAEREPAESGDALTERAETDPGLVLGTVGYMSPEQVRGQRVDHRSDIFSFGAVLYEMLAGKRAFKRDSSVETINAILTDEPPDLPTTGGTVPALDRVVHHCLEKSPEQRFQSARDIAFALEGVTSLSGEAPALPGQRREPQRSTAHHGRPELDNKTTTIARRPRVAHRQNVALLDIRAVFYEQLFQDGTVAPIFVVAVAAHREIGGM